MLDPQQFADILVINRSDTAARGAVARLREAAAALSGRMAVVTAHGQISATLLDAPVRGV